MNTIDPFATISPLADIENSKKGSRLIVGANSFIDAFVKIKFAGGIGDVCIGQHVYVNSGTTIYSGNCIKIDENALIAANCTIAATIHSFANGELRIRLQGFMNSRGGIVIESDVWIGANSVLLDGSHLKRGAIVAAGSVVNGVVPEFTIVAGAIARAIGMRGK